MGGKGGMVIIGFGVMWLAYAVGWTGYVLLKGIDIPLIELVNPAGKYSAGTALPAGGTIPGTQIMPSGKSSG